MIGKKGSVFFFLVALLCGLSLVGELLAAFDIASTDEQCGEERVYVASQVGTVSVIDPIACQVIATIPTGSNTNALAVSADGTRLYVTAAVPTNLVYVIDTATYSILARVSKPGHLGWITLTPDGERAFVTLFTSGGTSVLHIPTATFIADLLPFDRNPVGIEISPDSSRLYVVNSGSNSVTVKDAATYVPVATIPVGLSPHSIALSPDGQWAYVTNQNSRTVSVIDTDTNQVISTIETGGMLPRPLVVSPKGDKLYVVNTESNTVTFLTDTVCATVPVGNYPWGIARSGSGEWLYVANNASSSVSVINVAKQAVVATIPVGTNPIGVAVGRRCDKAPNTYTLK